MSSNESYEPRRFNFPDYEYYKVSKRDLIEFKVLVDEIRARARKRKAIDEKIINRFFTLLKQEKKSIGTKSKVSSKKVTKGLAYVFLYVTTLRRSNDYLFGEEKEKKPTVLKIEGKEYKLFDKHGNFIEMLRIVTESLRAIEYYNYDEWTNDKDFCMKEIFKEFVRYYWICMSPNQRKQYRNPYKFIALSALIAEYVWGFKISYTEPMTMYRYHQRGIYALKKFKIDIKRLMLEPY